ncbi:MAG: tetratricopeptide repeat protein [Verrucomicrobiota bacterium]
MMIFARGFAFWIFFLLASTSRGNYIEGYWEATHMKSRDRDRAIELFEESRQGALADGNMLYAFFNAQWLGLLHEDNGDFQESVAALEDAISYSVNERSEAIPALRTQKRGVAYIYLYLHTVQKKMTRIAHSQNAIDRHRAFLRSWAREKTGTAHDPLTNPYPARLSPNLQLHFMRHASAQSDLHHMVGNTREAVALLQRVIDGGHKALTQDTRDELRRCKSNLVVIEGFLGQTTAANRTLESVIATAQSSRSSNALRAFHIATLNLARGKFKETGPEQKWLDIARNSQAWLEANSSTGNKTMIARMERDMGEEKKARATIDKALEENQKPKSELERLYLERTRLELANLTSGEVDETHYEEQLLNFRQRGLLRGEPTCYREYAEFLAANGRYEKAIPLIAQAAALTERFGWSLHLPRLWMTQAGWHDKLGQTDLADALWEKIEALLASEADFPPDRYLEVLVGKVRRLALIGRMEDALATYQRAVAFVAASELTDYQKRHFKVLDPANPVDYWPEPSDESGGTVRPDFQPLASRTVVRLGEPARSRFFLSNPTGFPATGKLLADGKIASASWNEESLTWTITTETEKESRRLFSPDFVCGAGERITTELVLLKANEEPVTLELFWQPTASESGEKHSWIAQATADDSGQTSATTASVAERSPFYPVPFFQEIHSHGTTGLQDFRIVSSSTCRTEFYNDDGKLLAVDANGDGEFSGAGDLLTADRNFEGYPDVTLTTSRSSEVVEFHVFVEGNEEDISLEFQLKGSDSEWNTEAISTLQ